MKEKKIIIDIMYILQTNMFTRTLSVITRTDNKEW